MLWYKSRLWHNYTSWNCVPISKTMLFQHCVTWNSSIAFFIRENKNSSSYCNLNINQIRVSRRLSILLWYKSPEVEVVAIHKILIWLACFLLGKVWWKVQNEELRASVAKKNHFCKWKVGSCICEMSWCYCERSSAELFG